MSDGGNMADLKARVAYLESCIVQIKRQMGDVRKGRSVANEMISCYGHCVNKTEAANLLHVTRTSVYKYIKDGLLEVTGHGMVTTESIARCLEGRKRQRKDERYDEADG